MSYTHTVCRINYVLLLRFSVLWHCWLGGRKGIRSVKKTEWWGSGVVICLERCADLHMAKLMPHPLTVSCFSKIQIGFTFLVPAHLGCVCWGFLCLGVGHNEVTCECRVWICNKTVGIGGSSPSCWDGPSLLFRVGVEARGPKGWERGWGSWGGGRQPPVHQLWGLVEHCKLLELGLGQNPSH